MDDLSEKEQIEKLREWWSDYGNYILAGVAIGVLAIAGYNYQQGAAADREIAASTLFDTVAGHVAGNRIEAAEEAAAALDADYADTAYAMQARLALARLYMDSSRDADAAMALNKVIDGDRDGSFGALARLRLARVREYQENYDEVLELLDNDDMPGFTARYAEARGDALSALERYDEAREAYLVALADNGQTVDTSFLQLKIADLPAVDVSASVAGDVADAAADDGIGDTVDTTAGDSVDSSMSDDAAGSDADSTDSDADTAAE